MKSATHPPLSAVLPASIDGYDFAEETARSARDVAAVTLGGLTLHRATARVAFSGETSADDDARRVHRAAVFPTTLDDASPVLELGWPVHGHYTADSRGVQMDLYLGVGQRLVDDRHPRLVAAVQKLAEHGLLLRREINTDDFLRVAAHADGVHAPQDLAGLLDRIAAEAYGGAWRSFFTNSGTESVEACLKLACQVRYKRFVARHGAAVLARVMQELGIAEFAPLAADRSFEEPVYEDYPFFVVGCHDAFHGRTLGSLALTASKKAQKLGYPRTRWVRHVPFNKVGALRELVDTTPLAELLARPGALRAVVERGRVPADLLAGFLVEPMQGEGGYVLATPAFLKDAEATCRAHDALLLLDEVQTFGRSGTLLLGEQMGVRPDAIALAKGIFVGAMVARADLERHLHVGWHSNTWGGGKVFDVQVAHAVLEVLTTERSPVLGGRSHPENLRLKAKLLAAGLAELERRHPDLVAGSMVCGGLARLSVRRRKDVIAAGRLRGVKLLGCGRPGDVAAIRTIFLADVLGKEIAEALDLLDAALTDVETSPA